LLLIVSLLASLYAAPPASADPPTPVTEDIADCLATRGDTPDAERPWVQAGCCYANGGVCGCSAFGAVMCCDGRLSPTCMCRDGSPVTTLASMPE
jgi:hypothetical protein